MIYNADGVASPTRETEREEQREQERERETPQHIVAMFNPMSISRRGSGCSYRPNVARCT